MNNRQSIGIVTLLLAVAALATYGIYTTTRIRALEQRLGNAEERLRQVEADRRRVDQLGAVHAKLEALRSLLPLRSQAGVTPPTNGGFLFDGFLFDGLRPDDPVLPDGHRIGMREWPNRTAN